jgi:hypothetical protein
MAIDSQQQHDSPVRSLARLVWFPIIGFTDMTPEHRLSYRDDMHTTQPKIV